VPRGPDGRREGARTRVDVIDIACWSPRTRRSAKRLEADDGIRVEGALRRRFFRAGAGAASRYEVEARSVRRL
jgi:single-strand DNA-binding protein